MSTIRINSKNIVDLRTQKGWSQNELARQAGLSIGLISHIEKKGTTSEKTAKKIADTLNVTVSMITGGKADVEIVAANFKLAKKRIPEEEFLAIHAITYRIWELLTDKDPSVRRRCFELIKPFIDAQVKLVWEIKNQSKQWPTFPK